MQKKKVEYLKPSIESVADLDNLYLAWKRIFNSVNYSDVWYDEVEMHRFEFDLDRNIESIRREILEDSYRLAPIRPIPFPKGVDNDGKPRIRQAFFVSIRDQLVWTAVCNVLGPYMESKMPGWSTGNRLFVPMWKETEEKTGSSKWKCGSFMSTSSNIYRKWNQGWPRYRKALTASIKRLAYPKRDSESDAEVLDEADEEAIEDNGMLPKWMQVRYLIDNYFAENQKKQHLYWASIDIEQFYPHVKKNILKSLIVKHSKVTQKRMIRFLDSILDFTVDISGYTKAELNDMGVQSGSYSGIPTGLIVGGWLANVYFLDVDRKVDKELNLNKHVIHFRYVDDHTFISDDPVTLINWIHKYRVKLSGVNLRINKDKIQPSINEVSKGRLAELIENGIYTKEEYGSIDPELDAIFNGLKIDPRFPSPLMTLTLQKVSQLSKIRLRLISKTEIDLALKELKSLITIDLPEEEIKKETRISFAATMLSRMLINGDLELNKIQALRRQFFDSYKALKKRVEDGKSKSIPDENLCIKPFFQHEVKEFDETIKKQFKDLRWDSLKQVFDIRKIAEDKRNSRAKKVFNLLEQALTEMPDKVNIWIRTAEFCIRHLPEKLPYLFSLSSRNHRLAELASHFIRRQLLCLVCEKVTNRIWQKNGIDYPIGSLIKAFVDLESIVLAKGITGYEFSEGSKELYQFLLAFIRHEYDGIEDALSEFVNNHPESANFYLLWLCIHLPEEREHLKHNLLISEILKYANPQGEFIELLLLKLLTMKSVLNQNEEDGPLQELINQSQSQEALAAYLHLTKNVPDKSEAIGMPLDQLLDSSVWLNHCCLRSELGVTFLFSEIINSLIDTDGILLGDITSDSISVTTSDVKNLTWIKLLDVNSRIGITVENTFSEAPMNFSTSERETKNLIQLGEIYYDLLRLRPGYDYESKKKAYKYNWSSRIKKLETEIGLSTSIREVLQACLAPEAWEYRRNHGIAAPWISDGAIKNVAMLKKRIDEIMISLRKSIALKSTHIFDEKPQCIPEDNYTEIKVIKI